MQYLEVLDEVLPDEAEVLFIEDRASLILEVGLEEDIIMLTTRCK